MTAVRPPRKRNATFAASGPNRDRLLTIVGSRSRVPARSGSHGCRPCSSARMPRIRVRSWGSCWTNLPVSFTAGMRMIERIRRNTQNSARYSAKMATPRENRIPPGILQRCSSLTSGASPQARIPDTSSRMRTSVTSRTSHTRSHARMTSARTVMVRPISSRCVTVPAS